MKKDKKPTLFVKNGSICLTELLRLKKRYFVILIADVSDIREMHHG